MPAIDTAPRPAGSAGVISGTIRGPEGASALEGRVVEAVNVDTGERQRAATSTTGGFSFALEPGRYQVELTLRAGESLVRQPGIINLSSSGPDTHADFVVGTARISRPRAPAYRTDDGLGSPIA